MRVAIIADPFVPVPPPKYGGTEKVIHYLIRGLLETGHEPILLGPGDSKVDCQLIPTVAKSFSFPSDKRKLPYFKLRVKRVNRRTEKLIRELKSEIDVVHSMGFDMKDFKEIPSVTTLHGPVIMKAQSPWEKDIEYFKKRQHLNYISISKNQRDAHPYLNYIKVVYNGEDPAEFPIVTRPHDYVCFIGRFDREKNPHLAILLAINAGIKIRLGGKVDYLGGRYFREEVQPLLKNPLVEFLGELSRDETIDLVSKAKLNLHPTNFREPFGLTIIEAAYCGTPTLAIRRGSMPELIEDGKTGKLVEDFVEGFHYLDDCFKMNREYIAKRARRTFNYKNMTKGYLHAYRRAIKQARKT